MTVFLLVPSLIFMMKYYTITTSPCSRVSPHWWLNRHCDLPFVGFKNRTLLLKQVDQFWVFLLQFPGFLLKFPTLLALLSNFCWWNSPLSYFTIHQVFVESTPKSSRDAFSKSSCFRFSAASEVIAFHSFSCTTNGSSWLWRPKKIRVMRTIIIYQYLSSRSFEKNDQHLGDPFVSCCVWKSQFPWILFRFALALAALVLVAKGRWMEELLIDEAPCFAAHIAHGAGDHWDSRIWWNHWWQSWGCHWNHRSILWCHQTWLKNPRFLNGGF